MGDKKKKVKFNMAIWLALTAIYLFVFYKNNNYSLQDYFAFIELAFLICFAYYEYKNINIIFLYLALVDYIFMEANAMRQIVFDGNVSAVVLNIFIYFLCFRLLYLCINSFRLSIVIVQIVIDLLGIVNYYLLVFRGRALYYSDIFSLKTAMKVVDQYQLSIEWHLAVECTALWILIFVIFVSVKQKNEKGIDNIKVRVFKIIGVIMLAGLIYNENTLAVMGYKVYWFSHVPSNGFALGVVMQGENYKINKTDSYAISEIKDLSNTYKANAKQEDLPDVIVVMNESFSDLSVIGDINTNEDYMPFFRSLADNCIKGNLFVSVKAGNTANTEYEFLTGDSMSFYNYGQVVYNSYINNYIKSHVSRMNNLGYNTEAIHSYYKTAWNRVQVYNMMGFDNKYFLDDMDSDVGDWLRGFPSDRFTYNQLESRYEKQNKNFIFCVTVQNHGGYDNAEWKNQQKIWLEGEDRGKYPLTEQYLSLIKESDEALEELIDYYKKIDKKVILCFFGDHQPGIEQEFYEQLYGKKLTELSIEEQQKGYITPFLIWANYDIDSKNIDKMSVNYLYSYLCKVAGIPMSSYDNYLLNLYEKYPVINSLGAIDNNCNYYIQSDLGQIREIQEYYNIIYNQIIDTKNTVDVFFK